MVGKSKNSDGKNELILLKVVRRDVIIDNKKIAEKEMFYDNNDVLIKELVYKDMNENRRFDILDSITEYKKGIPQSQTLFKRTQVIKYNFDGSVRNISKFSD